MKRTLVLAIVLALSVVGITIAAQPQGGTIEGTAKDSCQRALSGAQVQLRSVDTGAVIGSTRAGNDGKFSFIGIVPAAYVVEIVDKNGKTIGVSSSIAVTPGAVITGIEPVGSAACALAAAAAAGGVGAFFMSTAGLVILGAAATATAAAVVVANRASSAGQ
jgi:hypothetical protein